MEKRKQITAEELTNCKRSRNEAQNAMSLNEVMNPGIPSSVMCKMRSGGILRGS